MSHDARFGATAVARVGLRAPGPVRLGQHTLRAASLVLRAIWVVSAGAQLAPAADEIQQPAGRLPALPLCAKPGISNRTRSLPQGIVCDDLAALIERLAAHEPGFRLAG
jgi:hypothetical protein